MKAVQPVLLTDPSGVNRELRFTPGARKRIAERFGTENIVAIFQDKGDWSIFEVAYYMMFDTSGQPPGGVSLNQWMECAAADDAQEVAVAIMSAVTQGRTPKNEIAEMLDKTVKAQQIGLPSGPSVAIVSESQTPSSGGDTPSENSTPLSTSIETPSESVPV